MTKRTVVYYWTGSTVYDGCYYIEVDYDNKSYSTGQTKTRDSFSSNVYLHSVPRYRDIKLHEKVLKNVGFKEVFIFKLYTTS